jgi:hypothetical protein
MKEFNFKIMAFNYFSFSPRFEYAWGLEYLNIEWVRERERGTERKIEKQRAMRPNFSALLPQRKMKE